MRCCDIFGNAFDQMLHKSIWVGKKVALSMANVTEIHNI